MRISFRQVLLLRETRSAWLLVLTAPCLIALINYLSVAPVGTDVFLGLELFYVFGTMAAGIGVIILPILMLFVGNRLRLLGWIPICLVAVPAIFAGFLWGAKIRMNAFGGVALRGKPLVDAIQAYRNDQGRFPGTLSSLVPGYLPEIPGTGMMANPEYRYDTGERAARYEGNPWILRVPAPSGGINFDEFFYFPLQNYPKNGHGGSFQRIRDWAYLHE